MKNPEKMTRPFRHTAETPLRGEETRISGFFRHEVPILAGRQALGPLCTVGFRGKIPLTLPSPTAC